MQLIRGPRKKWFTVELPFFNELSVNQLDIQSVIAKLILMIFTFNSWSNIKLEISWNKYEYIFLYITYEHISQTMTDIVQFTIDN